MSLQINDFCTEEVRIIMSKSYATINEIFNIGKTAERKAKDYLSVEDFGALFGLDIEGTTSVAMPARISYLGNDGNPVPILFLSFDQGGAGDIDVLMKALEDALSVKTYTQEEFKDLEYTPEVSASKWNQPRPVLNYENLVIRTNELKFEEKFEEIKDTLDSKVSAFVSNKLKEDGPSEFENKIINNLADAFKDHQALGAHYNEEIISAMEMHMQKGKQFGDAAAGIYDCNDIYIDAINQIYEKEKEMKSDLEEEFER